MSGRKCSWNILCLAGCGTDINANEPRLSKVCKPQHLLLSMCSVSAIALLEVLKALRNEGKSSKILVLGGVISILIS